MNTNQFSQTLLSVSVILCSHMIHYGYYDYIQKNSIVPNYNIFYLNFFLLFLGFAGLGLTMSKRAPPYIVSSLIVIIYSTTVGMMYQNIRYLKGRTEHPYNAKLYRPDVWILLNVLGWLVLAFFSSGRTSSDKTKITSVSAMFGIIIALYYIVPKSRINNIVDNPGYLIVFGLWIILAYYNSVSPLRKIAPSVSRAL